MALLIWLVLAVLVVLTLPSLSFDSRLIVGLFCLAANICFGYLVAVPFALSAPKGKVKPTPLVLAARGSLSFCVFFSAIYIREWDPLAGGIMSVFPAIATTVMVSLWVTQGSEVVVGAVAPLIFGGPSVPIYALVFGGIFFKTGNLVLSVIGGVGPAVGYSLVAGYLSRKRQAELAAGAEMKAAGESEVELGQVEAAKDVGPEKDP